MANQPPRDGDQARTQIGTDPAAPTLAATPTDPGRRASSSSGSGDLLGRGGMGEVRVHDDVELGRAVALKCMRPGLGDAARDRFLREAKLQARLEHPSIVPVYELGTAADGQPYFTMRKIGGITLERVIAGLRDGDEDIVAHHGRRRLLTDFVRVCQAIAYAHDHGVVHRDLKPANVILSEYGEVYVLDWGVAKILGEAVTTLPGVAPIDPLHTSAGSVLGTPGYMAPEQLDDGGREVDARADVYALGAMLFELLALEPLHPRHEVGALLGSTLDGADAHASRRAPQRDIPPELDAICVRATAIDPDRRYPDVRALLEQLERFLDGDRDQKRRRELAAEHAERARNAARAGATDLAARGVAAAEAGRALALDPDQHGAREVIARLLLEPPLAVPDDVARELERTGVDDSAAMGRVGSLSFAIWAGVFLLVPMMGVRHWGVLALIFASMLFALFGAARWARERTATRLPLRVHLLNAASLALIGTQFGPLVMVPGVAATTVTAFVLGNTDSGLRVTAIACLSFLVPIALQQLGLFPALLDAQGDRIVIHAWLTSFPPVLTEAMLVIGQLSVVVIAGITATSAARRLREGRRRQLLQAWHLRQMLQETHRTPAVLASGAAR